MAQSATIQIGETEITFDGRTRPLNDAAAAQLRAWAQTYATLIPTRRSDAGRDGLQRLGDALWTWLDGDGAWLSGPERAQTETLVFQSMARRPGPCASAVLNAPWELMTRWEGPILRRLGAATTPRKAAPYQLGVVAMAAAPQGEDLLDEDLLDYEGEEAAILSAVRATQTDWVVEESGSLDGLGHAVADAASDDAPMALHLSCHGGLDAQLGPVLALEDAYGRLDWVDSGRLIRELNPERVPLVFLSACLTAAPTEGGSFAQRLATGGVAAVVGWDGSVADSSAIAFAKVFYERLGKKDSVIDAVAKARATLRDQGDADWRLARLWLAPDGGGALVGGSKPRRLVARYGASKLLAVRTAAGKQDLPYAGPDQFVGRRRPLQAALRWAKEDQSAGLLIQAEGGRGKTSLAARLVERLKGWDKKLRFAAVSGKVGPHSLLKAVAEAVGVDNPPVLTDPKGFKAALREVLKAPKDPPSLALLIDDLEMMLTPPAADAPLRILPDSVDWITATIELFGALREESERCLLLFTSRYRFQLDGLERRLTLLSLPPMSREETRKQALFVLHSDDKAAERVLNPAEEALVDAIHDAAGGNPRVQAAMLTARRADPAAAAEVIADLRLSDLLAAAGEDGKALLRDLTIFAPPISHPVAAGREATAQKRNLPMLAYMWASQQEEMGRVETSQFHDVDLFARPIPLSVAATIRGAAPLQRLLDLGLVDVTPALVGAPDQGLEDVAPSPLAIREVVPLSDDERAALALRLYVPLDDAWGPIEDRPWNCSEQVAELILTAGAPVEALDRLAELASEVVVGVLDTEPVRGSDLVVRALAAFDEHGLPPDWTLLACACNVGSLTGDVAIADRAIALVRDYLSSNLPADAFSDEDFCAIAFEAADRLNQLGDVDEAEGLWRSLVEAYNNAGNEFLAAVTWGRIAGVLSSRDKNDEALQILKEVEFPAYERLSAEENIAGVWCRIAGITLEQGDVEEALRILNEVSLPIYERLGGRLSIARTWSQIADVCYAQGNLAKAEKILRKNCQPIYEKMWSLPDLLGCFEALMQIYEDKGDCSKLVPVASSAFEISQKLQDARAIMSNGMRYGLYLSMGGPRLEAIIVLTDAKIAATILGEDEMASEICRIRSQCLSEKPRLVRAQWL